MIVFISGGCKNGKSGLAEKITFNLSKNSKNLYYIATMIPTDDEDVERIERHKKDRKNYNFETIEISEKIDCFLNNESDASTYLLDSITALLANEMFKRDEVIKDCEKKIILELERVFESVKDIVVVSDFIYSDAIIFDELSEQYKKNLATLDKYIASKSDVVIEVSFGNVVVYKGKEILEKTLGGNIFELT